MSSVDTSKLVVLGSTAAYNYDKPDVGMLESFDSPFNKNSERHVSSIHIEMPEFTSLCPLTGQPDFANIVIDYSPQLRCVESKSLKLYLMAFRMHGEFHEACVNRISSDLIALLDPYHLSVEGRFTPRGGIPFWPRIVYYGTKNT